MPRIAIVGCPGSGKTTLARRLAADLGLTHVELDHLHWRDGWTEAPAEQFRADLDAALTEAGEGWVTCGNYASRSEGRHIAEADTVVWLDLPRRTVMARVIRRTVVRTIRREELFGRGLREPLTNLTRWPLEDNIIRWAWVYFPRYRERYTTAMADGSWDHAVVRHLRTPREVDAFARAAPANGPR